MSVVIMTIFLIISTVELYNIQIVKDCIYESHGRRYYDARDIFDTVTTRMKWLCKVGGYRIHVFALSTRYTMPGE